MDHSSEMKGLVMQCHTLTRKLKEKRAEAAKKREELDALYKQHLLAKEQWASERQDITLTIQGLSENVSQKREGLVAIEKESQLFAEKIEEKQRQTMDRKKIIQERNTEVQKKLSQMQVEEEAGRQRLLEFRDARDVAKKKLRSALEKMETTMAEDSRQHKDAIQRLQERTKEVEAQIEEEDRQWQQHLVEMERQTSLEARVLLQREKEQAQEGRKAYADMLHHIKDNGRRQQQLFQQVASLRAQLS